MAKEQKTEEKTQKQKVVKKAGKVKAKKKWVPILAPKSFGGVTLGETHVATSEQVIGKSVTANLMNLTGDMRKQGIEVRFDVIKVQDGKGITAVTCYEILPATLKRLMRRGRSKIADSFVARTVTGRLVRIKPVIITANPASSSACTQMRLAARERTKQIIASMSFDKLVQELIDYKVQRVIRDAANVSHPVKNVEVKSCVLLAEGTSEKREIREDSRDEDFVTVVKEEPVAEKKESEDLTAEEA